LEKQAVRKSVEWGGNKKERKLTVTILSAQLVSMG
jgi:hypothetical protein